MKKFITILIACILQLGAYSFSYTLHNRTVAEISLENYYLKTRVGNPVSSVRQKTREMWASIGINGSFFCPAERAYSYCWANNGTSSDRIVAGISHSKYPEDTGERGIIWVTADNKALFVQNNNRQWYMKNTNQYKIGDIYYGIGNFPILVDEWVDVTIEMGHLMDNKMYNKWRRSFICIPEEADRVFMGFVANKSVYEMGRYLIDTYDCHFAINLDAGASSAMVIEDRHIIGPGRRVTDGYVAVAKPEYIEKQLSEYQFSSNEKRNINYIVDAFQFEIDKRWNEYRDSLVEKFKTRESSSIFYPLVDRRALLREVAKRIDKLEASDDFGFIPYE